MWEKCRISWLKECVFGRRQICISPSLLMRNDQASTCVVCDHVNDPFTRFTLSFPETYSETSSHVQMGWGLFLDDTHKEVRKAGWSKRAKLTCTDVIVEALANSIQHSRAGKDLWCCPKILKFAYTFVLISLHQPVIRSKSPQTELISLNETAS